MQNNSSSLFSTEYSPLPQKLFPHKTYKNKELRQLKKFKTDKEVKLNLSSTDIHFCKNIPTLVSMFVFDNVYIYDILSDQLVTKFPMINEAITVGAMRNDGKVVLSGTESGKIIVHDVINKNVLRKYSAHTLDVNSIDIDDSLVKFASASKDCSFFIYELASKTPVREYKKSHSDYIKSVRFANCDSVLTGGFDKKIKLWDIRENSTNPVMEFDNGNICNDIHILGNNTNYFIANADNELVLYDIRKTVRLNSTIPMQSSITKLIAVNDNKRLFVVANGESFVKVCDIEDLSMRSLYSFNMKNKISSFAISQDMNHYGVGYESGDIVIKSKNITIDADESNRIDFDKEEHDLQLLDPSRYAEKPIVKNYKYFNRGQYAKNVQEGDIIVEKGKKKSIKKHDVYLKKFQYQKALDCVIKEGNVEMILAMFEELIDRNALKIALMNRSEEDVLLILKFILWKIRDVKAMSVLTYVYELMMKYYIIVSNKNKEVKEMFEKISKEVNEEIAFEEDLIQVNKDIESITRIYKSLN